MGKEDEQNDNVRFREEWFRDPAEYLKEIEAKPAPPEMPKAIEEFVQAARHAAELLDRHCARGEHSACELADRLWLEIERQERNYA